MAFRGEGDLLFDKQFYLVSDTTNTQHVDGYLCTNLKGYKLFHCPSITVHKFNDGSCILGDCFFTYDPEISINETNFLSISNSWGGRWVYISSDYLFTDFLSSKAIFYNNDKTVISSSLGVLREIGVINSEALKKVKTYKYYLPPGTMYEGVQQLLPGEYICVNKREVLSHGSLYFEIINKPDSELIENLSSLMRIYATNSREYMKESGYYQALTGGVDSRLTLSSFISTDSNHVCFTHSKPYLFMSESDRKVPKELSDKFSFNHVFTYKTKSNFNENDFISYVGRDVDTQVGSNFYYFSRGQMDILKAKYFIDNYYETGAKWMHGKGNVGKSKCLSEGDFEKDGYVFREGQLKYLLAHVDSLSNDKLDVLYFVKNFSTVGNLFCEMDYYMKPVVHMNSREFFSNMLSVSDEQRYEEKMLLKLLSVNLPGLTETTFNKNDLILKKLVQRLYYKAMKLLA